MWPRLGGRYGSIGRKASCLSVGVAQFNDSTLQQRSKCSSLGVENGITEQQYYYWLRRVCNEAMSQNINAPSCSRVKVDMRQMPVYLRPIRRNAARIELFGDHRQTARSAAPRRIER